MSLLTAVGADQAMPASPDQVCFRSWATSRLRRAFTSANVIGRRATVAEVVEIELAGGEVILAEVRSVGGDVGVLNRFRAAALRATIKRIGRFVAESVGPDLPGDPRTLSVEFGVKFAVKSGQLASVLAEVAGES